MCWKMYISTPQFRLEWIEKFGILKSICSFHLHRIRLDAGCKSCAKTRKLAPPRVLKCSSDFCSLKCIPEPKQQRLILQPIPKIALEIIPDIQTIKFVCDQPEEVAAVNQIWRIELNGPMSNHVQPKAALVFPIQSKYIYIYIYPNNSCCKGSSTALQSKHIENSLRQSI